jgi:Transcriptional regulator, AbiEi antitoxin
VGLLPTVPLGACCAFVGEKTSDRRGAGRTPRRPAELALGALARARAGVFTRADAIAAGLTSAEVRRRVRSGLWVVQVPGVMRAATTPDSIDARERAALARVGAVAALSHFSAARRWRMALPETEDVWITVPYRRNPRRPPGVRIIRSKHLPDGVVRRIGGVPVLDAARTIVDLAQYLGRRQLLAVTLQAMQREVCTYAQVVAWRNRLAGRAGLADLDAVLEEADRALESILAAEFDQLVSSAGVSLVAGYRLDLPDGRHVLCDFADPLARIDFEVDGFAYHSSPRQVAADRDRDRRLLHARWITVRYGTDDIRRHPMRTLADVHRQIAERRRS